MHSLVTEKVRIRAMFCCTIAVYNGIPFGAGEVKIYQTFIDDVSNILVDHYKLLWLRLGSEGDGIWRLVLCLVWAEGRGR